MDFGAKPPPLKTEGGTGAIRYSLRGVEEHRRGCGRDNRLRRATKAGPFKSLGDFAARINPKALNKRGTGNAGGRRRASMRSNRTGRLSMPTWKASMAMANRLDGERVSSAPAICFGGGGNARRLWISRRRRRGRRWRSCNPSLTRSASSCRAILSISTRRRWQSSVYGGFVDFEAAAERGATGGRLAGIVISARERRSQKGNKFAFAMFSDTSGQFEAVIFSDTLEPMPRPARRGNGGSAQRGRRA